MVAGGALAGPDQCEAGNPYCDEVTVSEASGADYETQTQIEPPLNVPVTSTIVHTSTGCIDTPANCGVANANAGGSTFTRRWLVTVDPVITSTGGAPATVTGVRRVTGDRHTGR